MAKRLLVIPILFCFLSGCAAAAIKSSNCYLQPPRDVQDDWSEKMCWQFTSATSRGAVIGGVVTGSILITAVAGAVDMSRSDNLCGLTPNEVLQIGYARAFTKWERVTIERTNTAGVPMPSPVIEIFQYYTLEDGTMGAEVTVSERLKSNNTYRSYVVVNEIRLDGNKVVAVNENLTGEEAKRKYNSYMAKLDAENRKAIKK